MKNRILKPILYVILILALGVILSGCESRPQGDPVDVLNNYYGNIKNNTVANSYDLLSDVNKKNWSKEDFINMYQWSGKVYPLVDLKFSNPNEYADQEIYGVKYSYAVKFTVVEVVHDIYNDKEVSNQYERYVVAENGSWKVLRDEMDIKQSIAQSMTAFAKMYYSGKGQPKDLNKAASILSEAITTAPNFGESYFLLGQTFEALKKYDDSINNIQQAISKLDDNKRKSDAYNILGVDYQYKKDTEKAKECFNQALQLDSSNKYAKANLDQVNKQ